MRQLVRAGDNAEGPEVEVPVHVPCVFFTMENLVDEGIFHHSYKNFTVRNLLHLMLCSRSNLHLEQMTTLPGDKLMSS